LLLLDRQWFALLRHKNIMGFGIMNAFSRLLFAGVSIGGSAAAFTAPAHATLQFTVGIPGKRALPALTTAPATPTRLKPSSTFRQ
jgi:predicted ribosomally synthesized peptide with SipW-like signal peptide